MMNEKKENRSVKRTKRLLTSQLIDLMKEKPINHISVKELTDLCDLNRGTFYLYYKDIYDMVEQLEENIIHDLNQIFSQIDISRPMDILDPLFEYIFKTGDLMIVLISDHGHISFLTKLKKIVKSYLYEELKKSYRLPHNDIYDIYFQFISSGFIGICEMWYSDYKNKTPHEMALLTEQLISRDFDMLKSI